MFMQTLLLYEFLQIQIRRILYYEVKESTQSPPLSKSSIFSTCSFLFPKAVPSIALQTRKQSLKRQNFLLIGAIFFWKVLL